MYYVQISQQFIFYEKCGFLLQGYQTMDYGEPVVAGLYERLI